MSMNWLEGMRPQMEMEGAARPMAMPVFAGQKLVVVGGSSGMGRQTAADVVAAGGSAVIIGRDDGKVDDTVQTLGKEGHGRRHHRRPGRPDAGRSGSASSWPPSTPTPPCWSTRPGFFIPKPFLDHDGAVLRLLRSNWTGRSSSSPRPWPAA